jgi:hypothetical protein
MTDPKIKTLAKEAMRKELLSIHKKKSIPTPTPW